MAARSTVTAFITWANDVPPSAAATDCPPDGPPAWVTRLSCARNAVVRLCKNVREGAAGWPARLLAKRTAAAMSVADPTGRVVKAGAPPPGTCASDASPAAEESCPTVPDGTRETTLYEAGMLKDAANIPVVLSASAAKPSICSGRSMAGKKGSPMVPSITGDQRGGRRYPASGRAERG